MALSIAALRQLVSRNDAIVKDAQYTINGYWEVTFSVAPGVDRTITVCESIVDRSTAVDLASVTLRSLTGQRVSKPR